MFYKIKNNLFNLFIYIYLFNLIFINCSASTLEKSTNKDSKNILCASVLKFIGKSAIVIGATCFVFNAHQLYQIVKNGNYIGSMDRSKGLLEFWNKIKITANIKVLCNVLSSKLNSVENWKNLFKKSYKNSLYSVVPGAVVAIPLVYFLSKSEPVLVQAVQEEVLVELSEPALGAMQKLSGLLSKLNILCEIESFLTVNDQLKNSIRDLRKIVLEQNNLLIKEMQNSVNFIMKANREELKEQEIKLLEELLVMIQEIITQLEKSPESKKIACKDEVVLILNNILVVLKERKKLASDYAINRVSIFFDEEEINNIVKEMLDAVEKNQNPVEPSLSVVRSSKVKLPHLTSATNSSRIKNDNQEIINESAISIGDMGEVDESKEKVVKNNDINAKKLITLGNSYISASVSGISSSSMDNASELSGERVKRAMLYLNQLPKLFIIALKCVIREKEEVLRKVRDEIFSIQSSLRAMRKELEAYYLSVNDKSEEKSNLLGSLDALIQGLNAGSESSESSESSELIVDGSLSSNLLNLLNELKDGLGKKGAIYDNPYCKVEVDLVAIILALEELKTLVLENNIAVEAEKVESIVSGISEANENVHKEESSVLLLPGNENENLIKEESNSPEKIIEVFVDHSFVSPSEDAKPLNGMEKKSITGPLFISEKLETFVEGSGNAGNQNDYYPLKEADLSLLNKSVAPLSVSGLKDKTEINEEIIIPANLEVEKVESKVVNIEQGDGNEEVSLNMSISIEPLENNENL